MNEEEKTEKEEEFDRDANGSIIIPDVEYNGEDEDDEFAEIDESTDADEDADAKDEDAGENDADETEDADAGDDVDGEDDDGEDAKEEKPEEDLQKEEPDEEPEKEPEKKPDDGAEKRIAELEKELADLKTRAKDALKAFGKEETDIARGLASVAAEEAGMTVEEYEKKLRDKATAEEAKRIVGAQRFEERARRDLEAIQAAFPETKQYRHMKEIPNIGRIGRLIDAGATPVEAYRGVNGDASKQKAVEDAVNAARRQSLNDTKEHLKSNVPKGSRDDSIKMTKGELRQWRELFPGKSDKEILKLYRTTK